MGEHMTTTAEPTVAQGDLARWSRLASFGFLLAAAGPLLFVVGSLFFGIDQDAFFVIVALVGIAAALLVRRDRTALKVVGMVLGTLLGLALWWTAFGLAYPTSFFDFIPGLIVLPGTLLGLGAGIAAIRANRRGDHGAGPRELSAIRGIATVVLVAAAATAVLTVVLRDTVSDEEAASADATVRLDNFEFDDDQGYELAGGSTVLVKNGDPVVHTFSIDALDIDETLQPGSEKLVTIPDEPGEYVLYCEPHTGHPDEEVDDDMSTTLVVG
jgi:plastocyanin